MEEDFDVYDDLDVFIEKPQEPSAEVSELNETLRNVTDQLTEANKKYENLLNLNKTLKYNISTILLTARRELTRKDERINSLVKEKDAIIFRRAGPKTKPDNELINRTGLSDPGTHAKNYKQTCDKCVQTEEIIDENLRIASKQKQSKCVQTDNTEVPAVKMYNESSQTDQPNKYFQTVRYVGERSILVKTEYVEVQEFVEKKHQGIQTAKISEPQVAKKSIKNSKSTVDDSDAIESLLALSRGCGNSNSSQKLLNDDYEKLLLDRQTILDELNKGEKGYTPAPVKRPGRPSKKLDKKKPSRPKEEVNSNLDIYELSPIHQMDKSKPIRQYGGGRGKQNSKLLQDCNKPICNNTKADNQDIEQTRKHDTEIKTALPQVVKKVETENIKHSRKQKFNDIRTNCNLEHIPTEPFEFQRRKANVIKPRPKVTRSRKRRLDALFDEAVDEAVTKQSLRSQKLALIETVEKNPILTVTETVEISPESESELPTSSTKKSDNQTISICSSNSKSKATSPVPLDLLLESPINIDNPIKSIGADTQIPPSPPPSVEKQPSPSYDNDNKIKRLCPDPELLTASSVELSSLPPNTNIEIDNEAINLETLTSQDGEEQNGKDATLNSSVEIKMSTTSYKIETNGDETTVYIRRNKKKKKHAS